MLFYNIMIYLNNLSTIAKRYYGFSAVELVIRHAGILTSANIERRNGSGCD